MLTQKSNMITTKPNILLPFLQAVCLHADKDFNGIVVDLVLELCKYGELVTQRKAMKILEHDKRLTSVWISGMYISSLWSKYK